MAELSLTQLQSAVNGKANLTHTHNASDIVGLTNSSNTKGIAFCFIDPKDNAQSNRVMVENVGTLKQIKIISATIPIASTTITVYKNGTSIASTSITAAKTIYDCPDIPLAVDDVLHVLLGTVYGLINVTVQLTIAE